MNKREREGHLPPAMLDMGMPEEMSTYPEVTGSTEEPPMVEITQPFQLGEGLEEISRPEDLVEDI